MWPLCVEIDKADPSAAAGNGQLRRRPAVDPGACSGGLIAAGGVVGAYPRGWHAA